MKLAIGSDHAGYSLKVFIKDFLVAAGHTPVDFGTDSASSVDYPDYAHIVSDAVERGDFAMGIIICGSGNGVNMTANKHAGIRAALCWIPEIARLARAHNDANMLALPARFIDKALASEIVSTFLNTRFEGGRHCLRVEKI